MSQRTTLAGAPHVIIDIPLGFMRVASAKIGDYALNFDGAQAWSRDRPLIWLLIADIYAVGRADDGISGGWPTIRRITPRAAILI